LASQEPDRSVTHERCSFESNDNHDHDLSALNEQARRCRRLAEATYNREVSQILGTMAEGYERTAAELSNKRVK
jgi:hypothetical protein